MMFMQLRRYWLLATATHILLMLVMLMSLLLPNAWYYPLLLVFQAALLLLTTFFAFWLTAKRLQNIRIRFEPFAASLAIIMLLSCVVIALTVWYTPAYALFAVTTPLTFGLLLWTVYPEKPLQVSKFIWMILAFLLAGVIVVRIYSLSVDPPVHRTDEGWALSWSVHYALTGQIDDLLMNVNLPSYELRSANFQLLRYIELPGAWLRLVGIGYVEMRLFSFIVITVIAALTTATAHNWYGRSTALWTAAATLSSSVLMRLADTRMDTGYTLALVTALYLSSEADKRQWLWMHFAAGFAAGLGVFSHLHAAVFGVVLTFALYLPRYVTKLRQKVWLPPLSALLFMLGGAIVGTSIFLLVILPDLPGFLRTIGLRGSIHEQGFLYSLVRNLFNIYLYSSVEFVMFVIGCAALLKRRQPHDWNLLLLVFGLHLSLSIVAPSAYDHYIRPLAPVYALITGTLLSQALSKRWIEAPTWAQSLASACLTVVLLVFSLRPAFSYVLSGGTPGLQTTPAIEWIQQNISPDQRLLAPTEYYLWLPEYTNMRSLYLEALQNRELQLNLPGDQIWDAVNARYIIYDSNQREDMLPESLFESSYLVTHGYVPVVAIHQNQGIVIIYEQQDR